MLDGHAPLRDCPERLDEKGVQKPPLMGNHQQSAGIMRETA